MAYKDEYEVARLLTQPEFERQMRDMWEAAESVSYNLHPPLFRAMGLKKKLKLGPWFRGPLRLLSRMKRLRGSVFDAFGYAALRREERALITWYRNLVNGLLEYVTPDTLSLAQEIACLPDQIRGYEQIKLTSIREVIKLAEEKLSLLKQAHAGASHVAL
jgi:indolepyruvate ferredoxin oxidoreductase